MSNSIYEKNMEALQKISRRTTDYINFSIEQYESGEKTEPITEDDKTFSEKGMFENIEIVTEKAFDGSKIFKIIKDGREQYLSGKREPHRIVEEWTENFDKLPRTSPIIMFGIGDGSFLLEINKKVKEDVSILVYEPSLKMLLKCLEETDLTEVFKKHTIIFGVDNNITFLEIRELIGSIVHMDNREFLRTYVLPGYFQLYPSEAKEFLNILRLRLDGMVTQHATNVFFSNIAMSTLLYNVMYLPDCHTTRQLLDVVPRDIPAIVVAAGPSLNKNIKELKAAKNKAFIIAVDTAIKPLVKEGIIPDMFVVVDAVKPVELIEVPEAEEIPLVASLVASQAVLAYHRGKKFFFDEGYRMVNKPFEDKDITFFSLNMGGSVGTTAFSLAYALGIDNIILVGQDLAYTNHKMHADGTFKKELYDINRIKCEMLPGNVEEEVAVPPDLKKYIEWYEYFISGSREFRPNLKVINATEGGAKIGYTEIMTLKEAIKKYCVKEVNVSERISKIENAFAGKNRNYVVDYLHGFEPGLRRIAENARKQQKIYKKIDNMANTGNMAPREYLKLLEKIKKLTKETLKSPLYDLVDSSLVEASLILQKELLVEEDSVVEEGKELARKGILYMDLMARCADLLADVAANSVSKVV